MSNQNDSTQRHPRRSRRNHKASGMSSTPSQAPSDNHLNTSHLYESDTSIGQATQEHQRCDPVMASNAIGNHNKEQMVPSTPPRSHSTQPPSVRRDQMRSEPAQGTTNRKDGSKSQNTRQKAPSRPSQSGTPSITVRPNTLNSGRVSETPSKAYAGPTFHASPAASSLPMPKFFSKSVPNVDKTTSLKNMMELDAPDMGSENEASPFVNHAKLETDRETKEESPLDIFFQADRKAKATAGSAGYTNGTPRGLSPFEHLRADASPSRGAPRHHSRHPTDSSTGGIFNLEMDSPALENSNLPSKLSQPSYDRSVSAPSGGLTEEEIREEQRQASTLALKKMLLLPQVQRSEVSSGSGSIRADLGSPLPKARQQRKSPTRDHSRPSSSPGLASDASRIQRQAALRVLAEKQIPISSGHINQRAPSSGLRKESTMPTSSGGSNELQPPGTPTPTRMCGSSPSANTRSQTKIRGTALDDCNVPVQSLQNLAPHPKQQREIAPSGPSPTTAAIENDLRRILKIDVLDNDGAPGVHS